MQSFDWSRLESVRDSFALRVDPKEVSAVIAPFRAHLYRGRKLRPVQTDPENPLKKLVVLHPDGFASKEDVRAVMEANGLLGRAEIVPKRVLFGYANMSADEVFAKILPKDLGEGVPSSFETVGHIAHLNLRDKYLPYKNIIGQVLLDKNKHLRTIVNKISPIESEFRTFPMEILAGDENLEVEIKQYGGKFRLNFAEVYWNSRLHEEHKRLVESFEAGQVLVDSFCGVGPFVIPAAKRGLRVFANDLNPASFNYLEQNVAMNDVSGKVDARNQDARHHIRGILNEGILVDHFVMNLPASALEFLDAFCCAFSRKKYRGRRDDAKMGEKKRKEDHDLHPLPAVHCYCFSDEEDFKRDILSRAEKSMGIVVPDDDLIDIRIIRRVAPNKVMYCLHFYVPEAVAFREEERNRQKLN